jgi:hypothetical protein
VGESSVEHPVILEKPMSTTGSPKSLSVIALSLALLTVAVLPQGWKAWQDSVGNFGQIRADAVNTLCSVTLQNGQIYYGTLVEAKAGYVKLLDVYYVQSVTQPNGGVMNRLVSRQKNDWHSPRWMSIPTDRILFVEQVGPKSQLADLVERDKGTATGNAAVK